MSGQSLAVNPKICSSLTIGVGVKISLGLYYIEYCTFSGILSVSRICKDLDLLFD